ncbi:MAG: LysE family translocator [Steroidobacteraceae bacterium]
MNPEQLTALVMFAIITSFTPGPNNAIAAATGANFGLRAALPHIFGVPFGMATLLLLGTLGAAALLLAHPVAMLLVKWLGIVYLIYIAWLIGNTRTLKDKQVARPLTFVQSALFQYANPKAWMMAVAAVGSYMRPQNGSGGVWPVFAVFVLCGLCSSSLWSWLGAALRSWLQQGARFAWFNRIMGASLAATAVWMLFE